MGVHTYLTGPRYVVPVVANFNALPPANTHGGKFFWCENAQGTAWLPGSLGGTYRPRGLYYSNGTTWNHQESAAQATQAIVDAGTNNDRFVTALTLKNAAQWDTKLDVTALPSNLVLYPTSVIGDVPGYYRLVSDVTDSDYDSPAVDIPTGAITGSNQLVASLIADAGLFIGNPGIINLITTGNIRRTTNNGSANFYYEVYHRDSGGTETLIATSSNTATVTNMAYQEFFAPALLNNGSFSITDRLVFKYYANKLTSATPEYEFQFGGTQPVRTMVPVPINVITSSGGGVWGSIVGTFTDQTDAVTYIMTGDSNTLAAAQSYADGLTAADVGAQPVLGFTPEDIANKGVANGYVPLNSSALIDSTYLPSYVDDVLEFANLASFPVTGESSKIYIALDTNLTYRWSGSAYVEISASLALGETSSTAYRGDRGKNAYDHSQTTGNPHGTTAADVGAATPAQVYKRTTFGNANYNIVATDITVVTSAAFTANRSVFLPSDAPAGWEVTVADEFQTVGTYTLTVGVATGKTLNGVTNGTEIIRASGGWRRFKTDGNGNWFFDAGISRVATSDTGTIISFTRNQVYNSIGSPATGNITDDLSNARIGIVQKIYHNSGTSPTFPASWVRLGSGNYVVSTLNIIYAEWVSGTRVEYWIVQ